MGLLSLSLLSLTQCSLTERFIPIASDSEQALKISRVVIVLSLIVGLFSFIGFIYSESLEMTKIYERLAYSFLVFIGIFFQGLTKLSRN